MDYAYDSNAPCELEVEEEYQMDADSTCAGNSDTQMSGEPAPTMATRTTPFLPQGTPPFQPSMGSLFAMGGNGNAQPADALTAEIVRKQTICTEGAKANIPTPILEMAANEGHSWDHTLTCYETARMASELYKATGRQQDLTYSQLAMSMANMIVQQEQLLQAQQQAVPTAAQDEATMTQDLAAASGIP